MLNKEQVEEIIFKALNSLNDERGSEDQISVDENTCLFGPEAALDSLSLVSLIVDVEGAVSEVSEKEVSLTDDHAMSQEISPFFSVTTLTKYILFRLAE